VQENWQMRNFWKLKREEKYKIIQQDVEKKIFAQAPIEVSSCVRPEEQSSFNFP